uniref:56 kDa type-specific antigen n=1 Tax=Macrostomum lignano TaxID=282301 RepID=A0A1I8GZF2_9PLAT
DILVLNPSNQHQRAVSNTVLVANDQLAAPAAVAGASDADSIPGDSATARDNAAFDASSAGPKLAGVFGRTPATGY